MMQSATTLRVVLTRGERPHTLLREQHIKHQITIASKHCPATNFESEQNSQANKVLLPNALTSNGLGTINNALHPCFHRFDTDHISSATSDQNALLCRMGRLERKAPEGETPLERNVRFAFAAAAFEPIFIKPRFRPSAASRRRFTLRASTPLLVWSRWCAKMLHSACASIHWTTSTKLKVRRR